MCGVSALILSDMAAPDRPISVPHVWAVGHDPCPTTCQETDQNPGSAPQLTELAQGYACPGSSQRLAFQLVHILSGAVILKEEVASFQRKVGP